MHKYIHARTAKPPSTHKRARARAHTHTHTHRRTAVYGIPHPRPRQQLRHELLQFLGSPVGALVNHRAGVMRPRIRHSALTAEQGYTHAHKMVYIRYTRAQVVLACIHRCQHIRRTYMPACLHTYVHPYMHKYMHARMHACIYSRDINRYDRYSRPPVGPNILSIHTTVGTTSRYTSEPT